MNSGRKLRKSTEERSRLSSENVKPKKEKRKSSVPENTTNPELTQKRPKLDTTKDDVSKLNRNGKPKRGRPLKIKTPNNDAISVDRDKGNINISDCKSTDHLIPLKEVHKSPRVQSVLTVDPVPSPSVTKSVTRENQPNLENEYLKKFNEFKYNSSAKTPSPLVIGSLSGNSSPQIIDNEELLQFLTGVLEDESKYPGLVSGSASEVIPGIQKLDMSPSRFFECPLCCEVFIDGDVARSHLSNTCPKLVEG